MSRNSSFEQPFDAPIMLDYMCHGWYSRETLRNKLGSGVCEKVVHRASRGAHDGMTLIYDGVNVESGVENIVYIRSPSARAFDRIRLGVVQWMQLCRWFLTNVQSPQGQLHYLYESREVDLNPLEFRTTMDDTILLWVEQYSGESETITSDRKLAKLLRLLDRDGKLCGPSSHFNQAVPADYNSGSETESIPDSFTGCAPNNHIIGPFVENSERNAEGFAPIDSQLSILYGCIRNCFPDVGILTLTHSLAVTIDVIGRIVEVYLNERGHYLTLDLMPCVPTSSNFWCKALEQFSNTSILRVVVGIIENGGVLSMSVGDMSNSERRCCLPVTASYFDKVKKQVVYCDITSVLNDSKDRSTGETVYQAIQVMNLMRDCCIEFGVLDFEALELNLAMITCNGGPDMQRSLCLSLANNDKLGYNTLVIPCVMQTHSLILATGCKGMLSECYRAGNFGEFGVIEFLKDLFWIMTSNCAREECNKLMKMLVTNDNIMQDDAIRFMEKVGKLDDEDSELVYDLMMKEWQTVDTVLSMVCKNWNATQGLLLAISVSADDSKVSKVSAKLHECMTLSIFRVSCEFISTFCALWYSPWYDVLHIDKHSHICHKDRHMVAGFRCGEMVMYCAAMELQLSSLVEDFKTVISDPEIEFPVIDDNYDGPMLHRPEMYSFYNTWKHLKKDMTTTEIEIQVSIVQKFLDKVKVCFDQQYEKWFTEFFFTALDSPDARVRKFTKFSIESAQQACSVVHLYINRPDIQLVLAEQKKGLNFIVRNHRVNNSGDAKLKLFWWCPQHSLDSLFQVLARKLLNWVSQHIEQMVSPDTGRTRQTASLWPVLERFQEKYPDNWVSAITHAVAGTQLHNQLSTKSNHGRVALGKNAQNQSSLVMRHKDSNIASTKKRKAFESIEDYKSEFPGQQKLKRSKNTSCSITSRDVVDCIKQVEHDKLSDNELETIQMFMTKLKKLHEKFESSRDQDQQVCGKENEASNAQLENVEIAAQSVLQERLRFTKITHEKAVKILNTLFPKDPPWEKRAREAKMIKTTLKRLAHKAGAIEKDERGVEYLNICIQPRSLSS